MSWYSNSKLGGYGGGYGSTYGSYSTKPSSYGYGGGSVYDSRSAYGSAYKDPEPKVVTEYVANERMKDGSRYTGKMEKKLTGRNHEKVEYKLRVGKGVCIWKNGLRYDGAWVKGKREGQGVQTWPGGQTYDGEWKDGKKSGYGVLTGADGSVYSGSWSEDLKTGQGKQSDKRGEYFGQFVKGKREGMGC